MHDLQDSSTPVFEQRFFVSEQDDIVQMEATDMMGKLLREILRLTFSQTRL